MHGGSATCRSFQSLKEAAVLPGLPHSSQHSASPAPPSHSSSEQEHGQASPIPTLPAWPRVPTLPLPSGRSGAATPRPGPCSREKLWVWGRSVSRGGGVVLRVTPVGTPIYAPPALRTLSAEGGELPRAGEALNGQGTTTSSNSEITGRMGGHGCLSGGQGPLSAWRHAETCLPYPKPDNCSGLLCVPGPRLCPKSSITIKHKSSLNSTQRPPGHIGYTTVGAAGRPPYHKLRVCPLPTPPTEAPLAWCPPHLQPHVPHSLDAPWVLLTVPTPTGLHVFGFLCFLCLNVPYQTQHLPQDAALSGTSEVGGPTLNVGKSMGSGVQSRFLHLAAYLTVLSQKGTLLHCWWECKLVQPQWRTVGRFLKKL